MPHAKSVETKRRLVEQAASLIRTDGYHATGISEILERSEVPKGSLYHHFPGGKEELAAASVAYSTERILGALNALAEKGGPVVALRAFCDHYIASLETSDFRKGCPLATIALETAGEPEPVHEACGAAFGAIVGFFADELRAAGVADTEAADLATHAVAAIEGALLLAKATADTGPVAIVRDRIAADMDNAIAQGGTP